MKQSLVLFNPQQAHQVISATLWPWAKSMLLAGHWLVLEAKLETRSNEQNRRLWAMLGEVSSQVNWHGQKLTADEWKDVFTAALKRQKVVPGLDGGFVVLGTSTRKMTKSEMSELQTLMEAFGAEQGVKFSAPEWEAA